MDSRNDPTHALIDPVIRGLDDLVKPSSQTSAMARRSAPSRVQKSGGRAE
jgi:hypothetical protein